ERQVELSSRRTSHNVGRRPIRLSHPSFGSRSVEANSFVGPGSSFGGEGHRPKEMGTRSSNTMLTIEIETLRSSRFSRRIPHSARRPAMPICRRNALALEAIVVPVFTEKRVCLERFRAGDRAALAEVYRF